MQVLKASQENGLLYTMRSLLWARVSSRPYLQEPKYHIGACCCHVTEACYLRSMFWVYPAGFDMYEQIVGR